MKFTEDLRSEMTKAAAESGGSTPIVTRHPAIITNAGESASPKSGEISLRVEFKLSGGEMDGVTIRDFINLNAANDIARKINLARLKKLLAAAGCPDAEESSALSGRRVLVTTKERPSKDGSRTFVEFAYAKDDGSGVVANPGGGTIAQGVVPKVNDNLPGFMRK